MPPFTPATAQPANAGPLPLRTLLRLVAAVVTLACAALVATCTAVMLTQADAFRSGDLQVAGAAALLHRDAYALAGAGAAVVAAVLTISLATSRTIVRRAEHAQKTALSVAQHQIPDLVRRLQAGEQADVGTLPRLSGHRDEFGVINDAMARLSRLASDSAQTVYLERDGFTRFATATAARALVAAGTVLAGMDELQRRPGLDTASRQELSRLDQVTVRLRRQLENLLLLTGGAIPDPHTEPVPVGNLILDAIGEVSQRERVRVDFGAQGYVAPEAAGALTHLLAELIENALAFSPPQLTVVLRSSATAGGIAFEIEDRGHGLTAPVLEQLNRRLQVAPLYAELAEFQQLGLFVVGRLAAQLDLSARLRPSAFDGVSAVVHVPARLLVDGTARERTPDAPRDPLGADARQAPVPLPPQAPAEPPAATPAPPTAAGPAAATAAAGPRPEPAGRGAARARPTLAVVHAAHLERTEDGLPQRIPGAHIAAPLQQRPARPADSSTGYGDDERTPEELAALFAHYPIADQQEDSP
ncbi:hypothetical protein GXW83_16245 [Streptacidiphilus sp. PB12-B1b]|uniref:sensor histidine kinase n=1 Tax=Streptacidiphilus sp. PB12-B1b TaxID=2705012 RepID=UPI0015FAB685|nr:ATP-binding protein [Streptacidiphilus sp. PB12-B1b]QMU77025.1 hypothetical protein GXW83_16245 [Streptacidiphilus sp. PB12-B1b]